ncbi:MAG: bifunctional nicotinamidase/pyrazinamidase [Acidobacteria bacterium]|nr:bifunctional nicotinamidase/pyrazinamidase [Acidobacteriota bacterium]
MQALIIVDLQNDFMPGGALAVPNGDEVVSVANRLMSRFELVVATQDWHPPHHSSFASQHPGHKPGDVIQLGGIEQVLWPDHCIQETAGAAFHRDLNIAGINKVFQKGVDPAIDSYSTFFDNAHLRSTGLADFLRARRVDEVCLLGLATDYCVKFSVLDAINEDFRANVIEDGCRGIDLQPGDVSRAFEEMRDAGARILSSEEI